MKSIIFNNKFILSILFLILFLFILLIFRIHKSKYKFKFGIHNRNKRKLLSTPSLFSSTVEILVSSQRISGTLELFHQDQLIIFKPFENTLLNKDEMIVIPFSENIHLSQTFAPIKWDNRNLLMIILNDRISRFQSDQLLIRFQQSYELELWYEYSHFQTIISFPKTQFLQRDISQLLSFLFSLSINQLNKNCKSFISSKVLKIQSIEVQTIPLTQSEILTSFDGSFEMKMIFFSTHLNIFSKSFLIIKTRIFFIPITIRLSWHVNTFYFKMNQNESQKCWIEIIPYQICFLFVSLGDYVILPFLSLILSFCFFLICSFGIGKRFCIDIKELKHHLNHY